MKDKLNIKIPRELYDRMLTDLKRRHEFTYERVGFLYARTVKLSEKEFLILAFDYLPVDDDNYIDDHSVGAKINGVAIRRAMQGSLNKRCGCFHVHLHSHKGKPSASFTDKKSNPGIIRSLSNIASSQANGIIILSEDSFYTEVKIGNSTVKKANILVIGSPFVVQHNDKSQDKLPIFDRQSFLGANSQRNFGLLKVGIVGYGGGGSHIGQQLAHLGVRNITVFDNDVIEHSNLNRLVGGFFSDVKNALLKTSIAKRMITKILPSAKVRTIHAKWQEKPIELQRCDIVFGCIDSYTEREQLETECRRYLIPVIDIGMDVHKNEGYSMSGQIILSMPGQVCMRCYGFITEQKLALEAAKYGDIGGRPQVVWPNGVLASTAIGIFVNLVTGWTGSEENRAYLSYNGNTGKIDDHIRKRFAPKACSHFPTEKVGPVQYIKL